MGATEETPSRTEEPGRISTGSGGLDALLKGGIPHGSLVLLTGPPGSGKSTIARQFLYSMAMRTGAVMLLSTSDSEEMISASMQSFGWETEKTQRIQIVDAYSWRLGSEKGLNLRNLTDLGIGISNILDGARQAQDGSAFVIDSFTDVLLNNSPEESLAFLGALKAKLQGKFTGLVLLEAGVHPDNVANTVEYLLDGTIRTKFDEKGRYVMVTRMLATPVKAGWWEFSIKKGVDVILADFFGAGER